MPHVAVHLETRLRHRIFRPTAHQSRLQLKMAIIARPKRSASRSLSYSRNIDPSAYRDRYQEALRALIKAKLEGLPIKPQEVITPKPVIDLMATLKRSLAQDMPAISGTTAKEKRGKPAAGRRQRPLLLPIAGGRKRNQEPRIEPAVVVVRVWA